ncbi:MAG: hypothetical protein JWM06_953 [Actinomycetia bacterium]|jgi:hypothetical protein|nr:hypothetical protein [Actinomycetes bacterium]
MVGLKKLLMGLMLFGAATYFGGGGTFASFSAETSNSGSSIASGTLTMSDTVNTNTACLSANATSINNANPACNAALTLANVAPGVFAGTAQITIQNTGSIDASKLFFWASSVNATLNAGLSSGTAATTLTVTPLEGTVTNGDSIVVSYGTHTQTFVASAGASGAATSISVTSQVANFSYPVGSSVTDTSSNSSVNNTNCFDAKTTVAGAAGATKGTDLNFNPAAGNPFCAATLIFVQETTGGNNYCWLGKGSSPEAANGACTAPISVSIRTALSTGGAITALPVTALNGNVASGDSIVVTSGSNTQTFTTTAAAGFGATSLAITSATPNFAYPITSTVVDSTTQGTLNSDTADTITNFDTAHGSIGRIQLYPVTANGAVDTAAPVQLSHFGSGTYSRTFQVGLYVPAPAGTNQNQLQGLASTFGITWHIDQ